MDLIGIVFDRTFYLATYPDVSRSGLDPLLHFVRHGWREGRDPRSDFSTRAYLERYADVAAAGVNPFVHFTRVGRAAGRSGRPRPEPAERAAPAADIAVPSVESAAPATEHTNPVGAPVEVTAAPEAAEVAVMRTYFDPAHYRRSHPELDLGDEEPLAHFCRIGWRNGLDPNGEFDTAGYLATYPDVAAAGINPFLHYLVHGRAEGRSPTPSRHPIRTAIHLAAEQAAWPPYRPATEPEITASDILRAFDDVPAEARAGFVVVVSHDDFRTGQGGVQNCVAQDFRTAKATGRAFLHVAPDVAGFGFADPAAAEAAPMRLAFQDGPLRSARAAVLHAVIAGVLARGTPVSLIVHHLMGHSPEALAAIARDLELPTTLWAHDFFLLCQSFALQRNGLEFCGAPPVGSNACRICVYGPGRRRHRARVDRFLAQAAPKLVVPSETALGFLTRAGLATDGAAIVPPVALEPGAVRTSIREPDRPLRIAHVGSATPLKGWPTFQRLTGLPGAESRYAFYHVGTHRPLGDRVSHVPATVSPDKPNAVVEALLEIDVDVVVNWTSCFETFSFVTHEALAAGAFVIVPRWAGHAAVAAASTGLVLDDDEALIDLFASGRVIDLTLAARRHGLRTGRLVPTGL